MTKADRTYEAARTALYALVPHGMVLGLEPIRAALAAWGNPQTKIPTVHVAGTNGKGSVSAMVEASLRASGLRTGLYTSPHLHRFSERVRIDGSPCDEALLGEAAWRVLDAIDGGRIPGLTFFEAATLIAWDVFVRAGVERVVLEVGLGGRLDATNVCVPDVTAITRIAKDHEARLGNTLAQIATEKAGILKPGIPCVLGSGLREGEAREAIERIARSVGAPLVEALAIERLHFDSEQRGHLEVALPAAPLKLDLGLAGRHQAENAAIAVGVLQQLGVSVESTRRGIADVRWPARFERIGAALFDAAHNPDGARALAEALGALAVEPKALVFGASADKDWRAMLDVLAPVFPRDARFFCAAGLRRAEDAAHLALHAGGIAAPSVVDAFQQARARVGDGGLVVVSGSIFTVAEARAHLLGIENEPPIPL